MQVFTLISCAYLLPSKHILDDHAYWFILDGMKHIFRGQRRLQTAIIPIILRSQACSSPGYVWLECWAIMMINIQLRMWLSKWRIKTRLLGYHDILNHDHFYRCWDTTSQKLRGVVLGDSNIKLGRRTRCTWVFAVLRLTRNLHLKEDLLDSSLRVPHFARSDRWF